MTLLAGDLVTSSVALARLEAEWRDLLRRSGSDEPMLDPTWLLAWWRVFGALDGRQLRVGTFRRNGVLVGLVPLLSRLHWYRRAVPFRRLEFLGSGENEADEICSDYLGIVAERGAEADVAGAFAEALSGGAFGPWDELVLPTMDGGSVLPALLARLLSRTGVWVEVSRTGEAPYVPLPSTWEAYLAKLASQRRYLVTRSLRDWEKWAGAPARLERVTCASQLEEGKRLLATLHGERWGAQGQGGVFRSARFSAFHDVVMPALLAAGALELAWLPARGEPVSVLYNLVWNGKVYFYQSGRKVDLPKQIRPGIVAHACGIRDAIAAGRREYDFLAGTSQYKMQLSLATRSLVKLRAVRSQLLERTRLAAEDGVALLRTLKRSPIHRIPAAVFANRSR